MACVAIDRSNLLTMGSLGSFALSRESASALLDLKKQWKNSCLVPSNNLQVNTQGEPFIYQLTMLICPQLNLFGTHFREATFFNYRNLTCFWDLNKENFRIQITLVSVFATLHSLQDLGSPTRNGTWATALKAPSPNHRITRGFPPLLLSSSEE